MFCHNCGKEVKEGAAFCPNCGAKLQEAPPSGNATPKPTEEKDEFFSAPPAPPAPAQPAPQQQTAEQSDPNTVALVGFVLSFFFAIPGLICSIIGLVRCMKLGLGRKGFAIAGIIISAASLIFSILYYAVLGPMLMEFLADLIGSLVE